MKNLKMIPMMLAFGILIAVSAHAAGQKCEKAGSYAPAGDDTYSVKCNGVVVKGAEILPEAAADELIRKKELEDSSEGQE